MEREIGSEFWNYTRADNSEIVIPQWLNWGYPIRFLACGRTSLHHIIQDIKATRQLNKVLMPSYCCHTMIEPFISNGTKVLFYEVSICKNGGFNYNINYNIDCDVFFSMGYFGFHDSQLEKSISFFKQKGKIVIEDATHSIFCKNPFSSNSHYVFASLRKWAAIPGGAIVLKLKGEFSFQKPAKKHEMYINLRIDAMKSKTDYINGVHTNKKYFLDIFHEAEDLLEKDYKEYTIDEISLSSIVNLDNNNLHKKRSSNAKILINGLKETNYLESIFKRVEDDDSPLFVPITIAKRFRAKLKQHLIQNKIFCPVHWPKSKYHIVYQETEKIYDSEISLVCDQRYGVKDMEKIIDVIRDFKVISN